MAQASFTKLDTGDHFPEVDLSFVDGTAMQLPVGLLGKWSVLLFARGHW